MFTLKGLEESENVTIKSGTDSVQSWMLVLLATNRGRQRSAVASQSFYGEVGASIVALSLEYRREGARVLGCCRALLCLWNRELTRLRFKERPTAASKGKQRSSKQDEVKIFFLSGERSRQRPVSEHR